MLLGRCKVKLMPATDLMFLLSKKHWGPNSRPGVDHVLCKIQIVNILGFADWVICVTTAQLCHRCPMQPQKLYEPLTWLHAKKTLFMDLET
jgi:hypothetical protein